MINLIIYIRISLSKFDAYTDTYRYKFDAYIDIYV